MKKRLVTYLLLDSIIKIIFMPVSVADVVTSCTSPWIPIVNSCKKANLLISNILRKLTDLNETSLAHRLK